MLSTKISERPVGPHSLCHRDRWALLITSCNNKGAYILDGIEVIAVLGDSGSCISCEPYSKTMTLLLFGRAPPSLPNQFGLQRSRLLLHLCCRTLRTFATETT